MKRIDRQFLLAARDGKLGDVKVLLALGANINALADNSRGCKTNALRLAATNLNVDVCHYLLDAGIDHSYYDAAVDDYPNLLATTAWDDGLCRRLIELGLDPHDYDGKGESLFVAASRHANLDLMRRLYSLGVDTGINRFYGTQPGKYSFSPLLFAAGRHDLAMTEFLLEIDCGQTPAFYKGITPMHSACLNTPSYRMVRPLGNTKPLLHLLLAHGADLHVRDEDGNTPLHYGCGIDPFANEEHKGDRKIIAALLELGADPRVRNSSGKRPVDVDDLDLADFTRGYRQELSA